MSRRRELRAKTQNKKQKPFFEGKGFKGLKEINARNVNP
jgi:hypothetical protein